jgi:hypothetical protein
LQILHWWGIHDPEWALAELNDFNRYHGFDKPEADMIPL